MGQKKTVNDFDQVEVQRIARDFVHEHVRACASSMVYELSQHAEVIEKLDIEEEIMGLSEGVPNYREAAEEEGWRYDEERDEFVQGKPNYQEGAEAANWDYDATEKAFVNVETGKRSGVVPADHPSMDEAWKALCEAEGIEAEYDDTYVSRENDEDEQWKDLCEHERIEPHRVEIYEHWIVSNYFARKMEEKDHGVKGELFGMTMWGRPCTGQAIYVDHAVQEAALEAKGMLQEQSLEEEDEQEQGQSR